MPSAKPSADPFLPAIAIETSRQPGSVALATAMDRIHHQELPGRGDLAAHLLPTLDRLCSDHDVERRTIALVVVGIGPGSFTGLRAGVAVAATIANWQEVPLVALPSFAGTPIVTDGGLRAVCLDALRGEVQGGIYRDGRELVPPTLTDPQGFLALLERHRGAGRVGGNGVAGLLARGPLPGEWQEYADARWEPRADLLLREGIGRALRSEWSSPEMVEPLYLRPSAAEERRDAT